MSTPRYLGTTAKFSGLDVFPNRSANIIVTLDCSEFTCRCPVTNQPDWARVEISYHPDKRIVESKSVKLYLERFREEGIFHEHLAQKVLDDFVEALEPRWCEVAVHFNTRGGIAINATARWDRSVPNFFSSTPVYKEEALWPPSLSSIEEKVVAS